MCVYNYAELASQTLFALNNLIKLSSINTNERLDPIC